MPVITFVFDDAAKQEVRLVEHEGLVLSTYEKNGYHDSDFYAVVWNPVKKTAESVMYATTSYGSYGNHAIIDASPDLVLVTTVPHGLVLKLTGTGIFLVLTICTLLMTKVLFLINLGLIPS